MASRLRKPSPLWSTSEFKKLPIEFRVGAILSDGQWYTADKVRLLISEPAGDDSVHRVSVIMNEMVKNGELIQHENGQSYCMSLKQMEAWRNERNIPLDAQVISRIVAPRVFGSKDHRLTENEFFAEAPLHQIGTVTFRLRDMSMLDEMKMELGWLGRFKVEEGNRCKLTCLSASIGRQKIIQFDEDRGGTVLTRACNSHNVSLQRELCELDQAALSDLLEYYVQFTPYLVPYVSKTFETYITHSTSGEVKAEGDSIICQWIIGFIQKFKEQMARPFSVLVKQILPPKVYEFSNHQIGNDVNKFQVNKNRAIKQLNEENGLTDPSTYYTIETIRRKMIENGYKISKNEYMDLDAALDSWRKTNWATDLSWDDGEQKQVMAYDPATVIDPFSNEDLERIELRNGLQHAIIRAGVESGDAESAIKALRLSVDSAALAEVMNGDGLCLGDDFKRALWACKSLFMTSGAGVHADSHQNARAIE